MSTIAFPPVFPVVSFTLLQVNNIRAFSSPYGSNEILTDMLNDRWKMTIGIGITNYRNAAAVEAFVNAQRNGINTVNLYHFVRPTPQGTMTGTPTLNGAHAAGVDTIAITGGVGNAGKTLVAGDIIGLGSLLLMIAANLTLDGSGNGTATMTNRLRVAQPSGAAITWNYPTAPFRLTTVPGVAYAGTQVSGMTLDYLEAVT